MVGPGGAVRPARRILDVVYAIPTRVLSTRQLTTGHCPAVPTRASQSDSRRCARTRRPAPPPTTMTPTPTPKTAQTQRPLDTRVHLRPARRIVATSPAMRTLSHQPRPGVIFAGTRAFSIASSTSSATPRRTPTRAAGCSRLRERSRAAPCHLRGAAGAPAPDRDYHAQAAERLGQ